MHTLFFLIFLLYHSLEEHLNSYTPTHGFLYVLTFHKKYKYNEWFTSRVLQTILWKRTFSLHQEDFDIPFGSSILLPTGPLIHADSYVIMNFQKVHFYICKDTFLTMFFETLIAFKLNSFLFFCIFYCDYIVRIPI